jgi:hypothetical protein
MSKGSIVTLVVLLAVILGGFLGFKQYQKVQSANEARDEAMQVVMGSKVLREHKVYIESLIDRHHAEAFKAGFKREHLFAPTEFDSQKYIEVLWERVASSANSDSKPDIAAALPGVLQGTRGSSMLIPPE